MDYFLSGGQTVAGLATLVLLWLTLKFHWASIRGQAP